MAVLFGACRLASDGNTAAKNRSGDTNLIPVGFAKVDITPQEPIRLSGYRTRRMESEGIGQRIWARAMAVGSDEETPAVLITAELVGIPGEMTNRLARRLAKTTSVDRTSLTVLTTHTHNGPQIKGVLPNIFAEQIPGGHMRRINAYADRLDSLLEAVAVDALRNRQPSHIAWGRGTVSFAQNRRVIADGKWTGMGINPDGPVDHDLPVLRVSTPNGDIRGILINYACHATTLSGSYNMIHGDWPGTAASMLESRYPDATAVMVAIGAGADANPQPRGGGLADVRENAETVVQEVETILGESLQPVSEPPVSRYKEIHLPLANVPSREQLEVWATEDTRKGYFASTVLDTLDDDEQVHSSFVYPIQVWAFGSDLAMVFLGGEVLSGYSLRLKKEYDPDRLWVSAYANAVPGYIATEQAIHQGGYEVVESMYSYGHASHLAPKTEDLIIETVSSLLPDAYK